MDSVASARVKHVEKHVWMPITDGVLVLRSEMNGESRRRPFDLASRVFVAQTLPAPQQASNRPSSYRPDRVFKRVGARVSRTKSIDCSSSSGVTDSRRKQCGSPETERLILGM
jgi:hypothetical protein